jgi:ribosomal protein L3 glutamine methyltransferase
LAYQFDNATVDAVDISQEALAVAEINIQQHGLSDRVFPIKSDLMEALQGQVYDLIVTNPPYVDAEDMSDLPDEFHHEPELGLAAGNDGLILVDTILKQASSHLSELGWLFVEVGNSQVHMQTRYPELAVEWIEFECGGQGVFAVNKAALDAYFG